MDRGHGNGRLGVAVASGLPETGHGTSEWRFDKWDAEQTAWVQQHTGLLAPRGAAFHRLGVRPYEVSGFSGNVITNAGWQAILNLATGSGTAFSSTKGRIGAGDGVTAVAATDTTLTGSTNKWFQLCGAAPVVGSGANRTWTFTATFGTSDGNFAWEKFGIDSGTSSTNTEVAALINAALSNQGTKVAGQTWTATAVLSFT